MSDDAKAVVLDKIIYGDGAFMLLIGGAFPIDFRRARRPSDAFLRAQSHIQAPSELSGRDGARMRREAFRLASVTAAAPIARNESRRISGSTCA